MGKKTFHLVKLISLLFFASIISGQVQAQWRRAWKGNNPTNDVTGSSFYSLKDGFISTTNFIAFATDSGKTITPLPNSGLTDNIGFPFFHPIFQWNGLHAINRDTIIGYGLHELDPFIATSYNGGQSWTTRYYYEHPYQANIFISGITDMAFPTRQIGYAVQFDKILKTVNGGQNWSQVFYRSSDDGFEEIEFPSVNTGYTFSASGLFKTTNGGVTWQQLTVPGSASGFINLSFVSETTGFINDYGGAIFKTTDGGLNWTKMNNSYQTIGGNDLKFINGNEGYATGGAYIIMKTNDEGRTWEFMRRHDALAAEPFNEIGRIYFFDNQHAWSSGTQEYLLKTDNAGGTTLPRAIFDFVEAIGQGPTLDTIRLKNYSRNIYSYQWFRNGQLFATTFDAQYTRSRVTSTDTIMLVVSNGVESDTMTNERSFYYQPPITPTSFYGLKELSFPFNDTLTGVRSWNQYAVASGKHGVYLSSNITDSIPQWKRLSVRRSVADSVIYNHTRFDGVLIYAPSGFVDNQAVAYGKDTISNKSVMVYFNFADSVKSKVFYNQSTQINYAVPAYNSAKVFAVGNNGLFIDVDTLGIVTNYNTQTTRNLYGIYESTAFENPGRRLFVAGDSIAILFRIGVGYEKSIAVPDKIKVVVFRQGSAVVFGTKAFNLSYDLSSLNEMFYYDFGPINASRAYYNNTYGTYIATNHGLFKSFAGGFGYEYLADSKFLSYTDFTFSYNLLNFFLATTTNGKIYRSRDAGGPVKPFVRIEPTGGCLNAYINISHTEGSSTTCKWFRDGVLMLQSNCNVGFPINFTSLGNHELKVIGSNEFGFSDTSAVIIPISNPPLTNINYTVLDTVLCKKERLNIRLNSPQPDHRYELYKKGSANRLGFVNANGGVTYFITDSLTESGYYYLRSVNNESGCVASFIDSFFVRVEKTKAAMFASRLNAYNGEAIQFFARSVDAQNYDWLFGPGANIPSSTLQEVPGVSFTGIGSNPVRLIAYSNAGCYDTTTSIITTVALLPEDTCFAFNFEDSLNWSNPNHLNIIYDVTKAGNEILIGGSAVKPKLESRYGAVPKRTEGYGLFLARYDYNGTYRWSIHSNNSAGITSIDGVTAVRADDAGNIYAVGSANSRNFIRFTNGDSVQLTRTINEQQFNPRNDGFIIKLDSIGRLIWRAVFYGGNPSAINFDNAGNLYISGGFPGTMKYYFNNGIGTEVFTLPDVTNYPFTSRYFLIKMNGNGNIIWKTYTEHTAATTAGAGTVKVKADALGNTYHLGNTAVISRFYNSNNTPPLVYTSTPVQNTRQIFLVKYDSSGNLLWSNMATAYKGSERIRFDDYEPLDLAADSVGNCYIASSTWPHDSTLSFIEWKNANQSISTFSSKFQIVKVSSQGYFQWNAGARTSTFHDFSAQYGPLMLKNDKLYVGIRSSENFTIDFDLFSTTGSSIPIALTSPDFILAKYDTSGALLQVSRSGQNTGGFLHPGHIISTTANNIQLFGSIETWSNGGTGQHSIYGNTVNSLKTDAFTAKISSTACGNNLYNITAAIDTFPPRMQIVFYDTLFNRNLKVKAIINDYTGVDSTPAEKPRIYFKKHFNGNWNSNLGQFISGTAKNGIWEFEIKLDPLVPVYMNDTIHFVIVAKETGAVGRIGSLPFSGNSFTSITNTNGITSTLKYIKKDKFDPAMSHTQISNPQIYTPIKLQATIVDSTGVYSAGNFAPRAIAVFTNSILIPNTTQYCDTAYGVLQSGTNKNGTWEFTFREQVTGLLPLGSPFRYFIASLDSTNRIETVPANFVYPGYTAAIYGDNAFINKVISDSIGPVSVFTPLPGSSVLTSNRITLDNVMISDTTRLDTSLTLRPRIYFKRGVNGTWMSTPGSLKNYISAYRSVWLFTIDFAATGVVPQAGDVIYYYVVSQDRNPVPNIRSNPFGAVGSSVQNITAAPSALYSFIVSSVTGIGNNPVLVDAEIKINPNPSNGNFTLQISGNVKDGTIRIWDAAGREMYNKKLGRVATPHAETITLNGHLSEGIYVIILMTSKGILQEKLIILR